jgi:hypothetical protein
VLPDQPAPDHRRPVQTSLDQRRPDHSWDDQTSLAQRRPDHMDPDQVVAVQLLPLKAEPDHMRPFQVPPVQAVPAARLEARGAVETASPKMSRSPLSSSPLSTRWAVPRAPSRVWG